MLELYAYDFSEYEDSDLNEAGEFGYNYLDQYWTETGRHPFLVRVNGKFAGFVFVNKFVYSTNIDHSIADFFILRKYRRKGIGRKVAIEILARFAGSWEIRALKNNSRAIRFWDSVISEFPQIQNERIENGIGDWAGPIWILRPQNTSQQTSQT
ncbi:acetyltransferase, GNAT family [Verrucomicrobiia bacterium DG1235]|nr:acetyltransferase, GNAT family [Verrucomicrobiae bacterium DG1235]